MAKYRVIVAFSDLKDNNHIYRPGDEFPRAGVDASIDRITSLAGSDNALGRPAIELVSEAAPVADPEPEREAAFAENAADVEKPKPKRGRRRKSDN